MEKTTKNTKKYDIGNEIFSYTAHDYHPHERGFLWYLVFSVIILGMSFWSFLSDPESGWFTSATILIVAATYFFVHRNGSQDQEIYFFERGLFLNKKKYIAWSNFQGFWFVYNETATVLNLQYKDIKNQKLSLQMGEVLPEVFQEKLKQIGLIELEEQQESLLDLWIRALKL